MASDRLTSVEPKAKSFSKGSCLPVTVEECSENVLLVNLKHGLKEYKGVLLECNTRLNQYGINLQRINSFSGHQNIEAKTTPCTTERFTYKYDGQPSALTVFSQNPIKRDRKPHHLSRILRPRRFICRKCKKLYLLDEDANGNSCNDDADSGAIKNPALRDDQSGEISKSKRKKYADNDDDSLDNGYDKERSQTIVHVTPSIIPKLSPKFPGIEKSDKGVGRLSYSPSVSRRNSSDSLSSKSNGGSKKRKYESLISKEKESKKTKKSHSTHFPDNKSSEIPSNSTSKVPFKKKKSELSDKKQPYELKHNSKNDKSVHSKPKKVALIDFDMLTHQKPNKTKLTSSINSKVVKDTQKENISSSKTTPTSDKKVIRDNITELSSQDSPKVTTQTETSSDIDLTPKKTQDTIKNQNLTSSNSVVKSKSSLKAQSKKKTKKDSQSDDSQSSKAEKKSSVYEFTDDNISSDSKSVSAKKADYEKPKNRWMREENIRRYQEARTSSIKNLREERPKRRTSLSSTSTSKSENLSPKRLSQTKKTGGFVGIKINRKREGSGSTESYKVQLLSKPEPSSPKPDLLHIDVSSPAESVVSMCNGINPPKVSKKMSTCKASSVAKAMGNVPKDVDKQSSVTVCNLANGSSFQLNDVVWAKITGYPFWPCKVVNITYSSKRSSGCCYTACVSWYAWDQVSYITCDKLLHFQQNYNAKFIKSKKGAYKLAVDQAWLESQNRSLLDEQETTEGTDNSSPKTDTSASHPVIARAKRSNANASISASRLEADEINLNEPLTQLCDDLPDLGPDAIDDNEIPATHIPTFSDDEFDDEGEHLIIDPEKLLSENIS